MSFFKVIDRPLRYTLQRRDGAHWQTAKAFTPERIEFRVLERMMHLVKAEKGGDWRILLMPFNVLAAAT